MFTDLFKNFKTLYSIFPKKFKIRYLILIFLSFFASFLEFFSISLLIPLAATFTGELALMETFNNKLGLDFLNLDNKSEEVTKLQHAVKQALLGLIIALMAHLDLVIAPFWAIFLASYYLNV